MNEAEILLTHILGCGRHSLYLDKGLNLDKEKSAFISSALKRRIQGEPIQYILGETEFMGLKFKVCPQALIPRQETELLVEIALRYVTSLQSQVTSTMFLEIGTGSGCIAVSLAKMIPDVDITATDISQEALDLAKENALLNEVESRINFIKSDLFSSLSQSAKCFSLIISNPPYIPTAEIESLQKEIQYEPRLALDGGKDGLDFYRKIIVQTPAYLEKKGLLVMEIGLGQADPIKNMLKNSGKFEIIEVVKDYSGIDRVVVAKLNPKSEYRNPKQCLKSQCRNVLSL